MREIDPTLKPILSINGNILKLSKVYPNNFWKISWNLSKMAVLAVWIKHTFGELYNFSTALPFIFVSWV